MEKIGDNLPELFYDIIGLFIPGFYFYFCVSLIYTNEAILKIIHLSFINETVLVLLLTYLAGHIIYSFSNYFIVKIFAFFVGTQNFILLGLKQTKIQKKCNQFLLVSKIDDGNDYYRLNIEKKIREITKDQTFNINRKNYVIAFEFCRNYIRENSPRAANVIRKEQAYGEMSRGIVFVSLVSVVILVFQNWYTPINHFINILEFYLFSLICFSYRYNQARYVVPLFIYSTFCSLYLDNKSVIRENSKANDKET